MSSTKNTVLLLVLVLAGLLVGVSGCSQGTTSPNKADSLIKAGSPARAGNASDRKPDRVRIEIDPPAFSRTPIVTITDAQKVQHLYTLIYALPEMPGQRVCTADLGRHYTLTFSQGSSRLVTVVAKREGCHPVSIAGEKQDRQATKDLWAWLDENTR